MASTIPTTTDPYRQWLEAAVDMPSSSTATTWRTFVVPTLVGLAVLMATVLR